MTTELCAAANRSGGRCQKSAGWGTSHPGVGYCRLHGGNTPSHQLAAAKKMAVAMGVDVDIEPHDALLWCVRKAAGQVDFASKMVESLEMGEIAIPGETYVERPLKQEGGGESPGTTVIETRIDLPKLNFWIRTQQDAMERLAKFAKMAIDAGVAERQVRLAERFAEPIVGMFEAIFDQLQLTPEQLKRAPEIVRGQLAALEAGPTEVI